MKMLDDLSYSQRMAINKQEQKDAHARHKLRLEAEELERKQPKKRVCKVAIKTYPDSAQRKEEVQKKRDAKVKKRIEMTKAGIPNPVPIKPVPSDLFTQSDFESLKDKVEESSFIDGDRTKDFDKTNCWIFTHCDVGNSPGFKSMSARRALWAMFIGDIPKGMKIYCACKNSYCGNPFHAEMIHANNDYNPLATSISQMGQSGIIFLASIPDDKNPIAQFESGNYSEDERKTYIGLGLAVTVQSSIGRTLIERRIKNNRLAEFVVPDIAKERGYMMEDARKRGVVLTHKDDIKALGNTSSEKFLDKVFKASIDVDVLDLASEFKDITNTFIEHYKHYLWRGINEPDFDIPSTVKAINNAEEVVASLEGGE